MLVETFLTGTLTFYVLPSVSLIKSGLTAHYGMLERIIKWSLDNRIVTLFAATLLLVLGGYAALTMPVDVFPDLTAPTVTVSWALDKGDEITRTYVVLY